MMYHKFTDGYVEQVFNDAGECIKQTFNAGDNVEYETSDCDPINVVNMPLGGDEYHPFDMVQPNQTAVHTVITDNQKRMMFDDIRNVLTGEDDTVRRDIDSIVDAIEGIIDDRMDIIIKSGQE